MKKIRLFLRNIPRKAKIVLNFALILLLLFWIYLLLGSPAGIKTLYRRAEKANLVGPGTILAVLEAPGQGYSHVVLAEDGNHVMVYSHDPENPQRTQLVYRERTHGVALLSVPALSGGAQAFSSQPVFLLDGYSDALRAELKLSLPDGSEETALLLARREAPGYFLFMLDARDQAVHQSELLRRLCLLSENTMANNEACSLLAQVRLYDREDTILADLSLSLNGS